MLPAELTEMALRGGDLSSQADEWAQRLEAQVLQVPGEHREIGKIDDLVIRRRLMTATVWDGRQLVLAARVDPVPGVYCLVDDVWVKSDRRGKGLFTKLLLFIKLKLKQPKIALGEVHSDDTYELLKSGGFKLFKKHWESSSGERAEFSTDTIDEFYGAEKWKLILESTSDLTPLLREESFTHSYDALVNILHTYTEI